MTRPPSTPSNERTGRRNVRDIDALKKRGPERWVYVGGGSTLCPAWQNGADHAGSPYDPVGFRFGVHGDLEFKGVVDVSAFTSGDVAWTMPAEYVPENDLPVATFVWNGTMLIPARYDVSSSTGDVTLTLTTTEAISAPIAVDLRNVSVNAYFAAAALTNFTIGRWGMVNDVDSFIYGVVRVPDSFSTLAIRLLLSSPTTSGDVRMEVATRAVGDGDTIDSTITAETAQTISLTTAMKYATFPTSGSLGSSPAVGDMLVVQIHHDGDHAADTLAVDLLLWGAWLVVT